MTDGTEGIEIGSYDGGSGDFHGYMNEVRIYRRELSAGRIKWNYENAPRMVDESQWKRVYDVNREFVGDMIVDNGLIRLSQGYRCPVTIADTNNTFPRMWGYSDGIWNEEYSFFPFTYVETVGRINNYTAFNIKELSRHKIVLQSHGIRSGTDLWVDLEYIINRSPFLLVKAIDWSLTNNVYVGVETRENFGGTTLGFNLSPRFGCISLDRMVDCVVDTGTIAGSETEGLSLAFSTQQNCLLMLLDQDNTDWRIYSAALSRFNDMFNAQAIDVDADNPPHWWGIGLMAFDTEWLQWQQNSVSSGDDWIIVGGVGIADGSASGGYAVQLDAAGEYCQKYFAGTNYGTFAKGAYRVMIRARTTGASTNQIRFQVYNEDDSRSLLDAYEDLTTSYAWYIYDFILSNDDMGDDVRVLCTRQATGNECRIDEAIIWPIGNKKNFPLDARNQALRIVSQKLRGAAK